MHFNELPSQIHAPAFWMKSFIFKGVNNISFQIQSERSEHISAINPENHYYFSFASFLFAAGHLGLGFQGPQQPLGR